MIKDNYFKVLEKIAQAALLAGRKPEDITLLAVSKFHTPEAIAEIAMAGQVQFAESYVQEAAEKIKLLENLLPEKIYNSLQWHSIGHIQTNKVKDILGTYTLIQGIDSLRLAQSLNKALAQKLLTQDILLEINIGEEAQKHGILPSEAKELVEQVLLLPQLRLKGFMCLPPMSTGAGSNRKYFKALFDLRNSLEKEFAHSFPILSMGTSGDYSDAVLENATHVRVGTEIFGERKK